MGRIGKLLRRISLILGIILAGAVSTFAQGTSTTIRHGTTLPATCVASTGQIFFLTAAAPTIGVYGCTATNTWTLAGSAGGINGISASLPFGTDTGALNAYVVTTTPTVALANFPCINFKTTIANTGPSTINVDATGAKNIAFANSYTTLGANAILANTVYALCYDGTEWELAGTGTQAGGTTMLAGTQLFMPTAAGAGLQTAATFTALNPMASTQRLIAFLCPGCSSPTSWMTLAFDSDNVFRLDGNDLFYVDVSSQFVYPPTINNTFGSMSGTDLDIQPGNPKTSGYAIRSRTQSGTENFAVDSLTGINTATSRPTVFVTSDFTDSTSTTLIAITGLTWTFPTLKAYSGSFHCSLMYDQATAAVSDSFGIGAITTAPTQVNANGTAYTSTTASTTGILTGLTTTTPTAIVTFTPSGITTVWKAELDGTIEVPSSATPSVVNIYAATTTGTDNFIVKRGSYCTLY